MNFYRAVIDYDELSMLVVTYIDQCYNYLNGKATTLPQIRRRPEHDSGQVSIPVWWLFKTQVYTEGCIKTNNRLITSSNNEWIY